MKKLNSKRTNWNIVARNLLESHEQISQTLESIKAKNISDPYLQVQIEHAIHHLYFAWNARKATLLEYRNLTDRQFNEWGKVPKDLELAKVSIKKEKLKRSRD